MAKFEVRGRCKNDLVAEKRRYAAAAQRKAQRAAHAGWRGDALQDIGLKEDGKMRRQVERRAAAQAKNRKASRKKARQRAEAKSRRFVGKLGWEWATVDWAGQDSALAGNPLPTGFGPVRFARDPDHGSAPVSGSGSGSGLGSGPGSARGSALGSGTTSLGSGSAPGSGSGLGSGPGSARGSALGSGTYVQTGRKLTEMYRI